MSLVIKHGLNKAFAIRILAQANEVFNFSNLPAMKSDEDQPLNLKSNSLF